ncbi:MAG: polyhydroxyalkanoic acid system family protein [Myxococcaceae bacterium]
MGMMKFEVSHGLPKDEAKKRIEALTRYWQKHGISSQWAGDSATINGKVMGVQFDAKLAITDKSVGGEGTDPGMLLRGTAKKYLENKFATFLDPSKSLSDLDKVKD